MNWFKKYSMILSTASIFAGVGMSALPYFEMYLEPWQMGLATSILGLATAIGRMIPQE